MPSTTAPSDTPSPGSPSSDTPSPGSPPSDTPSPESSASAPGDVEYFYCRRACAMCRRVQRRLDESGLAVRELVDADDTPLGPDEAFALAERATRITVTTNGQLLSFDMAEKPPTRRQLLDVVLAPSGHLRAPTVLVHGHLLVGFHEPTYRRALA